MLLSYKRGIEGAILRVKILDASKSTGEGLTGLAHNSTGLIIAAIADNEAATTAYTAAAGNVETITTLGTYEAPTAGKCRFRELDATNHPGVYEIHLADARLAVTASKFLILSIHGANNAAEVDALVPTVDRDPYTSGELTVTPASATVSVGQVTANDLTAYQDAAFGPYVFTINDSAGDPIDLSGKSLAFTVFTKHGQASPTTLWQLTSDAGEIAVSGANNNIVTISDDDTHTGTAGVGQWVYTLWNVTDDQILATGDLDIERAAAPTS